jgi:hypothetical protein
MNPRFPLFLIAVLALLSAGCRSFERDWKAAAHVAIPSTDPLGGRWIGTWQNTNNAHGGDLRAIVPPADSSNRRVRFFATWGGHSGSFTSPLQVTQTGDIATFVGRRRILGFLITTRGQAGHGRFDATYQSVFDNGTFTLRRVEAPSTDGR